MSYQIENILGHYYVRKEGVLSATRSPTLAKAQVHRDKLERGLVHFVAFKGPREHGHARTLPYQGYASNRSQVSSRAF